MKAKQRMKLANVVGPLLRRFRMEAGLSQKELASRCEELGLKLTRGTLAKIESRVRFIKACELFIIAKILRISLDSFYPPHFGETAKRPHDKRA